MIQSWRAAQRLVTKVCNHSRAKMQEWRSSIDVQSLNSNHQDWSGMPVQPVRSPSIFRCLVFVCLVLLCVSAAAQVVHAHSDQVPGTVQHCPICQILHSVTPLVYSIQLNFSFQTAAYLSACADSARQSLAQSFALFSRPPPPIV
jgi:hypothetical protein